MKSITINCCRKCPYYDGSDHEFAICTHSSAPKKVYENIVSRSHFKPEPIPKWCPLLELLNMNYLTKRDSNDLLISKIKLIVTAEVEK